MLVSFSRMRYYIYIIISFSLVFALIIHHQSNLKTLFEKYQGSKEINCQVNFLCGQVFFFFQDLVLQLRIGYYLLLIFSQGNFVTTTIFYLRPCTYYVYESNMI